MDEYVIDTLGFKCKVTAPTEDMARHRVARALGLEQTICSCGETYWGRRGEEMHRTHRPATLEEVDGYWVKLRKREAKMYRETTFDIIN